MKKLLTICAIIMGMAPQAQEKDTTLPKAKSPVHTSNIRSMPRASQTSQAPRVATTIGQQQAARAAQLDALQQLEAARSNNYNYVYDGEDNQKRFDEKNLTSKEISMEINAPKTADIFFENTQRTVQIKTWDQPKVKVVTTVWFEGEGKLTDEEWFEKLNISIKTLGTSVRIKSNTVSGGGSYYMNGQSYSWSSGSGGSGVAIFDGDGKNIGTKSNGKRYVVIYIPKENKLDVESKYADVSIESSIKKLDADITNGNLELLGSIADLKLRSKYSNVTVDEVAIGEIDFMNGNLSINQAKEVELDTKYSNIEIGVATKLNFTSTNDEYEIDEAISIVGRKNYGNLRIAQLKESLELDGTNADVKVKNIAATVSTIKVDNKYADLRLPLRNVKNYSVDFEGPYSTIYANFEKKAKPAAATKTTTRGNWVSSGCEDCNTDASFTATVGSGTGTKVEVKCQNCTVDFK